MVQSLYAKRAQHVRATESHQLYDALKLLVRELELERLFVAYS